MRTTKSDVRSPDEVLEFRVVARHGVILSHINCSHLKRVQDARARLDVVRSDATRIGLFEVSLVPASMRRDWSVSGARPRTDTAVKR